MAAIVPSSRERSSGEESRSSEVSSIAGGREGWGEGEEAEAKAEAEEGEKREKREGGRTGCFKIDGGAISQRSAGSVSQQEAGSSDPGQ